MARAVQGAHLEEDDEHLYAVLRYVERNALRAGLVPREKAGLKNTTAGSTW